MATAAVRDANGATLAGRAIAWQSSNVSVATISPNGAVTTLSAGTTTITATSEGIAGSATLTVQLSAVGSVSVALAKSVLLPTEATTANATVRDASNAIVTGRPLSWTSSNISVATVNASGGIVAMAPGTTGITALSDGIAGTAVLTVTAPVASVGVTLAATTIQVGQTIHATADVRDAANNQLIRTMAWSSSNSAVATVDASGNVKGVATGSASITATADGIAGSALVSVAAAGGGGGSGGNTPTQLVITTQPSGVVSGQPFSTPAVVEIRGTSGVIVSGATDLVTAAIASGTGTITAGGQVAATNGVATFTGLRISGSGPNSLRFTATGLTAATSNAFTVVTPLATTQAVASKTGTVNTAITAFTPVTASGGTTPYTYALTGGTLPAGMSFNTTTGQVSGTPTATLATTTFTVTVTDAATATSSKTFQLTVNAATPPLSTTQAVASKTGTVNTAIAAFTPVTASGGTTPYTFALSGGTLPTGMSFSTATGQVSGTPTAALATTTFTVTVTDATNATSSKTFQLTVSAASSTSECATPNAAWIFCDDFDTDRLSSYFEYDNAGGKFVRSTSMGRNGSVGMRGTFTTGQANAGALHLAFGRTPSSYFRPADAGTANYREVYWRFYVRREVGWVGNGPNKLTRATIFARSDFSQAMIAHGWTSDTDDRYLLLDPASGTDASGNLITVGYNDFANLRWLGGVQSAAPEEDQAHVGQWACYEFHAKLNDAGQSNGIFELTVNGVLSARKTGFNWIGSYNAYGINAVYLENFQNAGAPAANVRTLDNFVVSTQPIGCSAP
jgi:uncharacterized protein YjdB